MSFDLRAFIANHPAIQALGGQIVSTVFDVADDAIKQAMDEIPVVGGVVETIASPIVDSFKAELEAKVSAFITAEFAKLSPALAAPPAATVNKAAPVAAAPSAAPVPGGDPRMALKQAQAAARAAATTDNGQPRPVTDFGQKLTPAQLEHVQSAVSDAQEAAAMGTAP